MLLPDPKPDWAVWLETQVEPEFANKVLAVEEKVEQDLCGDLESKLCTFLYNTPPPCLKPVMDIKDTTNAVKCAGVFNLLVCFSKV